TPQIGKIFFFFIFLAPVLFCAVFFRSCENVYLPARICYATLCGARYRVSSPLFRRHSAEHTGCLCVVVFRNDLRQISAIDTITKGKAKPPPPLNTQRTLQR